MLEQEREAAEQRAGVTKIGLIGRSCSAGIFWSPKASKGEPLGIDEAGFLQDRYPSCCPANDVKELKG